MKYLCLVYFDEARLEALAEKEYSALVDESLAYDQVLRDGGHYLASSALQPVRNATTLRPQDGRMTITDGPFAETKEQLGGFILIEAENLDDALRLAAQIPPARLGCIEVRPSQELHPCSLIDPVTTHRPEEKIP